MARVSTPEIHSRFTAYLLHHRRCFRESLAKLLGSPISNLLTILVIAIALALPTGLYVLLKNARQISGSWDDASQITLYLKDTVSAERHVRLAKELKLRREVSDISTLTPDQALEEFKILSGFADALNTLEENPLPAVITVTPASAFSTPEATEHLRKELAALPEVDMAQVDLQWVQRFYAILDVMQRAIYLIGALLGLAVLLTIGNTIRLDIQNRREEIEVIKLIGGTNSFIRRPLLYSGLWYGFFGSLLAWLLVNFGLGLLDDPARHLALLYGSSYSIQSLSFGDSFLLLGSGTLLGWLGAFITVGMQLGKIEPH